MSETSQPIQVLDVFNKQNFHTGVASEFVKFPKAQSTVTMPNGVKFGDGTFQNSASTGSSLTVREETGSEISTEVSTIKVSNGTLLVDPTDNSIVTISTSGGGGGGSFTVTDNDVTVGNVSTLNVEALGTVVNAGSNTASLFPGGSKVSSTQTYSTLLTNHQFLVDPFNTTNVTTSGVTSSGLVASYTGTYERLTPSSTVTTNSLGLRHFKFDGNDDYIDFATSNSLIDAVPSTGSTTLWAWFLIDENESSINSFISTRTRDILNPSGLRDGAGLEIKTQLGLYSFRIGNVSANGFQEVPSTLAVTKGWHMSALTMTYNSSNLNYDYILYIDGVSILTHSDIYIVPNSGVRIGAAIVDNAVSGIVTDSFIGHCGITDSALSAADILSIYNELKPYYLTLGLFAGDLTGNVTGNLTGNVTGNLSGDLTATTTNAVGLTATGTIEGATLTDGVATLTTGALTGLTSVTSTTVNGDVIGDLNGNLTALTTNAVGLTATGTIQGGTLTDGNATLTGGAFTGLTSVTSSTLTDGTATLTGGALTNLTSVTSTTLAGEIQTKTTYGTTPSIGSGTLTLTTAGNTYETFDYTYTGAADTVSTFTFSGTQRNNSQYIVCIYNNGSGNLSFPTTISGVKVNHTSQVDVTYPAYAILTIFYKNSTNIFASVSVFS